MVFLVVLVATVYLYIEIPKGFMPDTDNDNISVNTEAAQGTSYYEMVRLQTQVNDVFRKDPNVETFMSSVGGRVLEPVVAVRRDASFCNSSPEGSAN